MGGAGLRTLLALIALAAASLIGASPQSASAQASQDEPPAGSTYVATFPATPEGYAFGAVQALEVADADPKILERKESLDAGEELTAEVEAEAVTVWEVGYFTGGEKVNLVVVDGASGLVTESWTGAAVAWPMARGRDGQFGHLLNAPWVWGPLALLFLAGLFDFRRPRKWVHLDLLVLLSFGVSQAFFNAAEIGVSVPLYYPPLVYLLGRMLWIGLRGPGRADTASEGLRPSAPLWVLAMLCLVLVGGRIAMNVTDSGVIDVGYAGVIGADRIIDAEPIYGEGAFPENNPTGDTYGPANYFAYVPFERALPWSGAWDALPAAHAAAIFFDLATVAGLFLLGRLLVRRRLGGGDDDEDGEDGDAVPAGVPGSRRSHSDTPATLSPVPDVSAGASGYHRSNPDTPAATASSRLYRWLSPTPGNVLGATLAFAWLAYPYSTFALQANSNDALLSALLVWSLVAFASPLARGGLLAVASLAKFAPLALVPLYAAGERGIRFRVPNARHVLLRPIALFAAAFVAGAVLLIAHPAVDPGLADFYDRTVRSQVERTSPFSIWGQADLEWLQTAAKLLTVALAIAVAFVPKRRSLPQVAALAAAVILAVEITLEHWFYLYIPWFLGMMLVAIAVSRTDERRPEREPAAP